MTPEILMAFAAIITAIGVPLIGWFTYLGQKVGHKNNRDIGEVHGIVNSQNEALVAEAKRQSERIERLIIALGKAGVAIPVNGDD